MIQPLGQLMPPIGCHRYMEEPLKIKVCGGCSTALVYALHIGLHCLRSLHCCADVMTRRCTVCTVCTVGLMSRYAVVLFALQLLVGLC